MECLLCVGTGIDGGGAEFSGSKFCEDCSVIILLCRCRGCHIHKFCGDCGSKSCLDCW